VRSENKQTMQYYTNRSVHSGHVYIYSGAQCPPAIHSHKAHNPTKDGLEHSSITVTSC